MENKEKNSSEISLVEILSVLRPSALLIISIGIVFGLISFTYTKFFVKPIFESNATLIVNNKRDENTQSITNDEILSAKSLASVYRIIITSDAVTGPVLNVTESSLSTSQLADKISVSAVDNTQVIKVSVTDNDPNLARIYTGAIVDVAPSVIEEMVEAGSVKVVSQPTQPLVPISPNVKMNTLFASILGILLSVFFILIRFYFDKTFTSIEDIEYELGLPILGVIPNYESVNKGEK